MKKALPMNSSFSLAGVCLNGGVDRQAREEGADDAGQLDESARATATATIPNIRTK